MAKRQTLGKALRFEVLKRDAFTCQYCGRKAPDVLLEVDHIEPVSKGGTNSLLNLISSCKDCNAGKSDRRLEDTAVLDKQRAQLEELQARREQLELMFEWQKGLSNLSDSATDRIAEEWNQRVHPYALTKNGVSDLRRLIKTFSVNEVMEAIKVAVDQYVRFGASDIPIEESVNLAWEKLGGICRLARLDKEDPGLRRLYYIRGILRQRLSYCDLNVAIDLLKRASELNASPESLEAHAKSVKTWTAWRNGILNFINAQPEH
ncbi:HNH endonuclease [Schlesneria sp. T3-172]|uniref:HNH endonuclease n=1 Tax=Schlesneria sphaerica TaxID=3373610 RepID=UPI0037C7DA3F